jgi:prephenate dehydrogenase
MGVGQILMDIASFKEGHFGALRETSQRGIIPLSVHPMYGPAATSLNSLTVAVVPVVDPDKECRLAGRLFEGVDLVRISSVEHDETMANILSLTYLMNMAFAATVKDKGLENIRKLAGTSFMVQLGLSSSIVGEDVSLVDTLLHENPHAGRVYRRFVFYFNRLQGFDHNETGEFIRALRESDGIRDDYVSVNKWRHHAYERYKEIVESTV